MATVVPCETAVTALADAPARRRIFRIPSSTASDGSSGVDGVLVVKISPVVSSTATTSVNVPPVSIPMRRRPVTPSPGRVESPSYGIMPAGATCSFVRPTLSRPRRTRPDALASSMNALT